MRYTLQIVAAWILCFAPCLAFAQDCGESVTVSSGDTLFGIAQECGTSVSALVDANDQVTNPDVIRIGWELRIPDGERVETDPQPPRTEPERPRTEPRQSRWTGSVRVAPGSGAPGTTVRVLASGFPPTTAVNIGVGPVGSEYEIVRRNVRTNANGGLITSAQLPEYADPNSQWRFVVVTEDQRIRGRSEPFDVRAEREGVVGDPADDRGEDRVVVRGQLTDEGVECPALRDQDGTLYTLTGSTGQFSTGDHVRVEGTIAEMSICMQGTTIAIHEIRSAR